MLRLFFCTGCSVPTVLRILPVQACGALEGKAEESYIGPCPEGENPHLLSRVESGRERGRHGGGGRTVSQKDLWGCRWIERSRRQRHSNRATPGEDEIRMGAAQRELGPGICM